MWLKVVVVAALLRIGASQWWNNAVYYRIFVDSFKDGDGDGLGDLKGATKQLSYVRAVGADAVIISPLSTRNTDCSNPGITDFAEIDPRYGNLDNFIGLLEKAKKLELKVVITLPIQSVSKDSEWFKSSVDRVAGFEDWIVWKDGSADTPPQSDTIDWKWHDIRNAYWASTNSEAMVNLCSENVAAALSAAQCAWIRRGVSGVLLNPDFLPDVPCGEKLLKKLSAEAMSCARSANMETPVIMLESSLPPEVAAKYYGDGGVGANSVLSQALTNPKMQSAAEFGIAFHAALLTAPEDATPAWITSKTNDSRIATRFGSNMVDSINLLALILPGATVIQQGDELGTADTILEWVSSTTCWPNPAHPAAAPFPWDDSVNAGFSTSDTWMPLAPNYRYANAKTEYANEMSHLGVVKLTAAMRKSPAIGPHVEIKRLNGALAVMRWGGHGSLIVLSNLGRDQTDAQLSKLAGLPNEMTVVVSSAGSSLSTGSHVAVERTLKLSPGETVLLAGGPRHCGGPGPVDKIANKLSEGWQKINKYFSNM